ncbi:MAG: beta-propeller domain-containing protein, partial [Thaumarchaeota archaeon]|nr:beta-propeller domain-containing protein [Nitrososphaerota archaeon]
TPVLFVAIMLVLAAAIGFVPTLTGNNTVPSSTSSASSSSIGAQPGQLRSFQNSSQLQNFMAANAKSAQEYDAYGGAGLIGGPMMLVGGLTTSTVTMAASATAGQSVDSSATSPSFTGTNVQVQGVDEPDIVKTDGTHIFVASTGSGSSPAGGSAVTIVQAYPPSSNAVLSTVSLSGQVIGIEVAQGRLMVIDQLYTNNTAYIGLFLYNTSSLSSPRLISNVTVAGTYVAARMAQGYLYAVVQQPSYTFNGQGNATGVMPYMTVNGQRAALPTSSIFYTPNNSQIGDYTMIASVSMASGAETTISVLTGPSSTVYVSTSDIYVVYSDYRLFANVDGIPGNVFNGGVPITSPSVQQDQNSTIFRASYSSDGKVVVRAVGTVPGSVLNQFSMDEYNSYFRVATSRLATIAGNSTESDDVYVLNQNMSQVSALRNIAPGENLYAVRFAGDMGYVVTFEQVDPLFAISFADIAHPVILSALKVNGYSDYLQPLFGNSYLLGVGKDTVASSTGNFAYYLGLKLSLFHVAANGSSSDVSDYMIGDRGTDSPVLTDHLALTYDPANNITVIPVLLAQVPANEQSSGTSSQGPPPFGNPVWQGAYVFRVNSTGFTLLGRVTQYPANQNYGDSPNGNLQIERSIIIGGYLYTISQSELMVSSLSSLTTVATVSLPGS